MIELIQIKECTLEKLAPKPKYQKLDNQKLSGINYLEKEFGVKISRRNVTIIFVTIMTFLNDIWGRGVHEQMTRVREY